MGAAILVLLLIPFINTSYIRNTTYRPIFKFFFWLFVADYIILTWIGQMPVREAFIFTGQVATFYYFLFFLFLIPVIGKIEIYLLTRHPKKEGSRVDLSRNFKENWKMCGTHLKSSLARLMALIGDNLKRLQSIVAVFLYSSNLVLPGLFSLFLSIWLIMFNIFYSPCYTQLQVLVSLISIVLSLNVFIFRDPGNKPIFVFYVFNSILVFSYIRFFVDNGLPLSIFYFVNLFVGFHVFKRTFSTRHTLRTKSILLTYYKKSEFIKIFLWILLIFIPSLIMHVTVLIVVYQPLMMFCFLSHYDTLLTFLSLLLLWCFLLFLMNKYDFGHEFLKNCLHYFSRRACLHYVGNTFGARIRSVFG